jgi:hypothetical protein
MEDWVVKHMHAVLIGIEILWVAGFLSIFVVYFLIKRRLRADKRAAALRAGDLSESAPPLSGERNEKP